MYIPPFLQNPASNQSLISTAEVNDLLQARLTDAPKREHVEDKVSLSEAAKAPSLKLTPIGERPTAQQSADVILGFMGQYLQSRAADGASAEELEESYETALKGFKQGLSEAVEIINGLGLSNEALSDSIAETERLVLEGLDKLYGALTDGGPKQQEEADRSSTPSTVSTVVSASSSESISTSSSQVASSLGNTGPVQAAAISYAESYSRNESVDLQILTRDGDRITLSYSAAFSSSQNGSIVAALGNSGSVAASSLSSSSSLSTNFTLSIEGYLDQGEQDALSRLLAQIEELADEFFGGDLNKAFELALDLEMDFTELAALSLDLNQSMTQSAAANYSVVQQLAEPETDREKPINSGLGELIQAGKFIGRLLESLEKATESFSEPGNLLSDLLANQLAQRSADDVEEPARLLDRLLEQIS